MSINHVKRENTQSEESKNVQIAEIDLQNYIEAKLYSRSSCSID